MTRLILLDIEGTTTPIDFVHRVLFPYAAERLPGFLARHVYDRGVAEDLAQLACEHAEDLAAGRPVPPLDLSAGATGAEPYLATLMAEDRKSTALKALQGRVWAEGYAAGELQGVVFPDVAPALAAWFDAGLRIAIFSSGSIEAQQLLFRHSNAGDLTPYLSGYFDTRTGPKRVPASYTSIVETMEATAAEVLFVSDIPEELQAAQAAGLDTALSLRPGNAPCATDAWWCIDSLAEIPATV